MQFVKTFEVAPYEEVLEESKQYGDLNLVTGSGLSMGGSKNLSFKAIKRRMLHANRYEDWVPKLAKFKSDNLETFLALLGRTLTAAEYEQSVTAMSEAFLMEVVRADREAASFHPQDVEALCNFISPYKDVAGLQYDSTLYRADMHSLSRLSDGFGRDFHGNLAFKGFSGARNIFYPHGAIFIKSEGRLITKIQRTDGSLLDEIAAQVSLRSIPIILAGTSAQKIKHIQSNEYTKVAFDRIKRWRGAALTFGASLSISDTHILEALISSDIKFLGISVYDQCMSSTYDLLTRIAAIEDRIRPDNRLEIRLFDSATVGLWKHADQSADVFAAA